MAQPSSAPAVIVIGVVLTSRSRATRSRESHERAVAAQQARHQAWLEAPPPPLLMPGRFTQTWFQTYGPHLHPGQVAELITELRARGWTDQRIASRVLPWLPR